LRPVCRHSASPLSIPNVPMLMLLALDVKHAVVAAFLRWRLRRA